MKFEVQMSLALYGSVNIHFVMNGNIYVGYNRGDLADAGWFCLLIGVRHS